MTFKEGDVIKLKSGAAGYHGLFVHGEHYTVGGPHHAGNLAKYTGIVLPDRQYSQWYTVEFEYANGPW